MGTKDVGTFTHNLTGLTAGERYHYLFKATTTSGGNSFVGYSNTSEFVTLGTPEVLIPGATDVTKTSVTLNADLNSTGGVSYTTGSPFSGGTVPGMLLWMDGNDPDADGIANTTTYNLANGTGWKDKSGSNRHMDQVIGTPSFTPALLNGLGAVYFDGSEQAYLSSANSLAAHTENFSVFLISRDKGTTSTHSGGHVNDYDTGIWRFGVANMGHIQNVAYFGNSWLYPSSADSNSRDSTNFHLYQATLDDQDNGNVWLDQNKVRSNGSGANNGSDRKPGRIGFGGYDDGSHSRSICEIAEFVVLNRVVSEDERLKIEGYLARKWGLMSTLFTAAHPYYSADPYQTTVSQGGEDAVVTFYWGDNNGSTTPGNWDYNQALPGTHGIGVVSRALSGLTTGTTYYYTAKATTSAGTSWGPVQTFVPANTVLNKYSIPNLALWIDATDLNGDGTLDSVTSGTAVSSWTDKSLGGETVTQSNSDLMPTRQLNSFGTKPAVRFDGTGDMLAVSTIRAESGEYSVYASVRRPSQMGDTSGHLVSESTWNLIPSSSNTAFPEIIVKKSGTAGSLTNIKLGKSTVSTINDFGGDLGELLIFTSQLSTSEEQQIEGYLAHKWGGTDSLNSDHPYKNVAPIFDNKPLIRDISEFSNSDITYLSGMEVWFDASDLDADGVTDSTASGNISSWSDKSGNSHHALTANGTPELKTTSGPSNGRVVEIRGGDYLPVSGSFFVKDMFFVFRSPPTNSVWSGYGGPFGRNPSSGHNLRSSNYITENGQTYFHSNQLPADVFKNGTALNGSFNLGTITNYMVVRLIV
ncbi:hypothetical protein N9J83_08990, partial [Opitutales bacterium]|nr:hypothetical protein [Opitutales bacterium]